MPSFVNAVVVFLAAVASVNGLVTPHIARHNAHHRSIAARVAEPQVQPALVPRAPTATLRKRCRPRLVFVTPSPSPSTAPAPSPEVPPVNVAPSPSPEPQPEPEQPAPVPSPEAPPAPVEPAPQPAPQQPAPQPGNGGGNQPGFMSGTQTGQGTFYDAGLGACGIVNTNADYIAAVSHLLFDNYPGYNRVNPNTNPLCGRTVTATYQGRSVTVAITDRCEGCAVTDLDFTPSAFAQLADHSLGRISGVTWHWN